MLSTTDLYSMIPVWMTFTEGHRVMGKLELVQLFCYKAAWSNPNVCNGWLCKGDDITEDLSVWRIWTIWAVALHVLFFFFFFFLFFFLLFFHFIGLEGRSLTGCQLCVCVCLMFDFPGESDMLFSEKPFLSAKLLAVTEPVYAPGFFFCLRLFYVVWLSSTENCQFHFGSYSLIGLNCLYFVLSMHLMSFFVRYVFSLKLLGKT